MREGCNPAKVIGSAVLVVLLLPTCLCASSGPDTVYVGIRLQYIDEINTKANTFKGEFYLWFSWKGKTGAEDYQIINALETHEVFRERWKDQDFERLSVQLRGNFRTKLDLKQFPFDVQLIEVLVEDYEYSMDELVYAIDTESVGLREGLELNGWELKNFETEVREGSQASFSQVRASIQAKRLMTPFLVKVMFPLFVIVAVSMMVFFIGSSSFETQAAIGVTAMLSMIAFHISLSSELPEVDYLVTFDLIMMVSYFFVFLGMVWIVIVYRFVQMKKETKALKFERIGRRYFPLLYVLFLLITAVVMGIY
jgi:hypothetical protein